MRKKLKLCDADIKVISEYIREAKKVPGVSYIYAIIVTNPIDVKHTVECPSICIMTVYNGEGVINLLTKLQDKYRNKMVKKLRNLEFSFSSIVYVDNYSLLEGRILYDRLGNWEEKRKSFIEKTKFLCMIERNEYLRERIDMQDDVIVEMVKEAEKEQEIGARDKANVVTLEDVYIEFFNEICRLERMMFKSLKENFVSENEAENVTTFIESFEYAGFNLKVITECLKAMTYRIALAMKNYGIEKVNDILFKEVERLVRIVGSYEKIQDDSYSTLELAKQKLALEYAQEVFLDYRFGNLHDITVRYLKMLMTSDVKGKKLER